MQSSVLVNIIVYTPQIRLHKNPRNTSRTVVDRRLYPGTNLSGSRFLTHQDEVGRLYSGRAQCPLSLPRCRMPGPKVAPPCARAEDKQEILSNC